MRFNTKQISGLLALLGLALLVVETAFLGLYHEEPTRVLVALSMVSDGHWFVPHILGDLYLKKPPGFNWWITLFSLPFGEVTVLSARVSVIVAWGLLGLIAGGFGGGKPGRFGWYEALATWFSLSLFMEKAALAELDLFLTLVLFVALMLWYVLRRVEGPRVSWLVSGLLLGLALLVKGPVAYLFYYPPIAMYLIWTRNRMDVPGFILGFVVAHLPVVLWLYWVIQDISMTPFVQLVMEELFNRGSAGKPIKYFVNLAKFPLVAYFSFLPWCFVFLGFLYGECRETFVQKLTDRRKLMISALVPFLFFWWAPVSSVRYILPLFPWLGVLSGDLFRLWNKKDAFRKLLHRSGLFLGGLLVVLFVAPWVFDSSSLIGFPGQLIVSTFLALTGLVIWFLHLRSSSVLRTAVFSFVGFLVVLKFGYLFLFVPSEEPQRMILPGEVKRLGQDFRRRGIRQVLYGSEHRLEIPYYLQREGLSVRKSDPTVYPEDSKTLLLTLDEPEEGKFDRKVTLYEKLDLYVVGPSKARSGENNP